MREPGAKLERQRPADEARRRVRAERVEAAVRDVEDLQHPEHQRQPERDDEQPRRVRQRRRRGWSAARFMLIAAQPASCKLDSRRGSGSSAFSRGASRPQSHFAPGKPALIQSSVFMLGRRVHALGLEALDVVEHAPSSSPRRSLVRPIAVSWIAWWPSPSAMRMRPAGRIPLELRQRRGELLGRRLLAAVGRHRLLDRELQAEQRLRHAVRRLHRVDVVGLLVDRSHHQSLSGDFGDIRP